MPQFKPENSKKNLLARNRRKKLCKKIIPAVVTIFYSYLFYIFLNKTTKSISYFFETASKHWKENIYSHNFIWAGIWVCIIYSLTILLLTVFNIYIIDNLFIPFYVLFISHKLRLSDLTNRSSWVFMTAKRVRIIILQKFASGERFDLSTSKFGLKDNFVNN